MPFRSAGFRSTGFRSTGFRSAVPFRCSCTFSVTLSN